MKLKKLAKKFNQEVEVRHNNEEISLALILTHSQETNCIGIFPYTNDGTPLQMVEYLCEGFLKECEILTMYRCLTSIKNQNPALFQECKKVLLEKHYEHYEEVMARIILEDPTGEQTNKEVS